MTGSVGKDKLNGGGGNDTIFASDGQVDTVIGGPNGAGGDTANVDCGPVVDTVTTVEHQIC